MWVFELTNNPNLGENIKLEKINIIMNSMFLKILKLKDIIIQKNMKCHIRTWNAESLQNLFIYKNHLKESINLAFQSYI